ncbi:BTAD domain-containing putative transcriptional regulator [uncultured Jatrophihabitans sp.]|uniref:BTAD domain-containing putative transcriptional regulator n=1 Tax=uncultured Jatrophihabitans sp. TaxID=1610747 RepID=UPI0035CA87FB
MQLAVLGPLEAADDDGRPVAIAGARVRALVTRLAVDAGRAVALGPLAQTVWGDTPPAEETNALQTLVSRARRALGGPSAITQSPAGYRLEVDPGCVDLHAFTALAASGGAAVRAGEYATAVRDLDAASALWRGDPLVDAVQFGDALAARVDQLTRLWLGVRGDRAEALLAGDPAQAPTLVGELEALALEHPLDERLAGQLVRALAIAGRQADALAAYERVRVQLADELGVDPSAELQQIQLAVLRGELAATAPAAPRRTNLKAQLTSFVGRDAEVARIAKTLEQNRLVTLVGPGGAGKTRLASEAAARCTDNAPDGTWLVELAQVSSGADVPQAVVAALGLRETHLIERRGAPPASRDALARLLEGLAGTQSLLILDNCEHVIEAAASLADQLLADNEQLRILTTSREPLGITGETLLAVPPLGQPAADAGAAEALEFPAVRLFADRAAAVRPDFSVDDTTIADVIEIVRRLDGLPLAIELAAARLRTLPVGEISTRLSDRFRLLTGGSRTALPRHRTLRAVVEWSWGLLSAPERTLAEQLSVFGSGITAESAAAVSDTPADVPELLASLIDKSLLAPVADGVRLRMLETIREYGMDQLGERGELVEMRRRHADYFADLLATAEPHLTQGDQLPWFKKIADEQDNILSALRFRCDDGDADGSLRIAIGLSAAAMLLGNHADVPGWVREALSTPGDADPQLTLIARALLTLNVAAGATNEVHASAEDKSDLAQLAEQLRDVDTTGRNSSIHLLRPAVAYFADLPELAADYIEQAAESDDPWARAAAGMFRASFAENEGDVAGMRAAGQQALTAFRAIGERWGITNSLRIVAQLAVLDGDLDAGATAYEEALALTQELRSHDDEGFLLSRLADLELRRGNLEAARRYTEQVAVRAEESGSTMEAVFALVVASGIERRAGDEDAARRTHKQALTALATLPEGHPAAAHISAMLLSDEMQQAMADGEPERAGEIATRAYTAGVDTHDSPVLAIVGVALADHRRACGDPVAAAQVFGAAARLRGSDDWTAIEVAQLRRDLIAELGAGTFATEYERGKALDREAAVERLRPTS